MPDYVRADGLEKVTGQARYAADVLLPGIATCQKCHNGARTAADSRCSEWHDYHDWTKAKPTSSVHAIVDFSR